MAQHNSVPITAPFSGANLAAWVNELAAAFSSLNEGTTPPLNPVLGMPWLDSSHTPAVLKKHNGSDWELFFAADTVGKSANYTVAFSDLGRTIRCTADLTLTLLAASAAGNGWSCQIEARGGDVTISPDGSDSINATTLLDGQIATLFCDGSGWRLASQQVTAAKIAEVDVDGAATVEFTLPNSRFTHYRVVGSGISVPVNGSDLRLRTSADGGATFDSGATDYYRQLLVAAGTSVSASGDIAGSFLCTTTLLAGQSNCIDLLITDAGGSGRTGLSCVHSGVDSSTFIVTGTAGGQRAADEVVDAIRFYLSSGTITGKFTLYGLG